MGSDSGLYTTMGLNGLFAIFVALGCIALAWILLQEVKWDAFVRNPRSPRARMIQVVLAVIVGHLMSRFFLDYWEWAGAMKWLFRSG